MSDNDNAKPQVGDSMPLLGDVWRRNLAVILAQHFGSSLSAMSEASSQASRAAEARGEEGAGRIAASTLSRWTNGKALVDRLNKIDLQLRQLGLGLDAYTLVGVVGSTRLSKPQRELFNVLSAMPALRLQGLMPLLRSLSAEEPDAEEIHAEVDAFLRKRRLHAGLSSGLQALYENLDTLAMSEEEQQRLLAQVDQLTEQISTYSQR